MIAMPTEERRAYLKRLSPYLKTSLAIFGNGIVIGVIFSLSVQMRGVWLSLLSIVPHGLLELPAVFLGTSIGLMVGSRVMKQFFRPPETTIGSELVQGLRFFITVILPLLFIAALVEAFLTSALVTPK